MISHPDKLLFPADGISKGELAAYYEEVASVMLPHLRGRPVTMERFPAGIEQKGFMQKDVAKGFPEWLVRVEVAKKAGSLHHPLIDDARSLAWLANQNCITPHVWTSRTPCLSQPDLCVFDLDPADEDLTVLRTSTLAVRELLAELGLRSWVKTSGSKGFHVVVPLDAAADFDAAWEFSFAVGAVLVKRAPDRLTQEFIKSDRAGRILVDTGRNGYGATFAAAYAVRARPGAPVSAPCTWEEVESGAVEPRTFTLREMSRRLSAVGDLWADMLTQGQSLTRASVQVRSLLTADELRQSHAAATRKPRARKAKSDTPPS
jgi:bifunctional non-homologous end joining protein LigD